MIKIIKILKYQNSVLPHSGFVITYDVRQINMHFDIPCNKTQISFVTAPSNKNLPFKNQQQIWTMPKIRVH